MAVDSMHIVAAPVKIGKHVLLGASSVTLPGLSYSSMNVAAMVVSPCHPGCLQAPPMPPVLLMHAHAACDCWFCHADSQPVIILSHCLHEVTWSCNPA